MNVLNKMMILAIKTRTTETTSDIWTLMENALVKIFELLAWGGGILALVGIIEFIYSFQSQNPETKKQGITFIMTGIGVAIVGNLIATSIVATLPTM